MAATRFDANGVEYLVRPPDLFYQYPEDWLRVSFLKHTRIPDLYASCIIMFVLAFTALALRCRVRQKTKQLGWDDYTLILGLVTSPIQVHPCRAYSRLIRTCRCSFSPCAFRSLSSSIEQGLEDMGF